MHQPQPNKRGMNIDRLVTQCENSKWRFWHGSSSPCRVPKIRTTNGRRISLLIMPTSDSRAPKKLAPPPLWLENGDFWWTTHIRAAQIVSLRWNSIAFGARLLKRGQWGSWCFFFIFENIRSLFTFFKIFTKFYFQSFKFKTCSKITQFSHPCPPPKIP